MGWEVLVEQSLEGGERKKLGNNVEWQKNAVGKGEK